MSRQSKRVRLRRMKLLTIEETLERVLDGMEGLPAEDVPLEECSARNLARPVSASIALPRFDNSTMDGYAVRAAEAVPGAQLSVVGEQPAGRDLGMTLGEHAAIRIYTGAPLPQGADAVIMQEDCRTQGDTVFLFDRVAAGENIRRRGSDLIEGQLLARSGDRISAQRLGLLASQGLERLSVHRRPRVGIFATGSELRKGGEQLAEGEIYESNRIMIVDLVRQTGSEPVLFETVEDDEDLTVASFQKAEDCDALVIVGGMSVGKRDYVKPALRRLGAEIGLWRVAVKPGKPFLFGRLKSQVVFGLPGNPVSAFVTFYLFVRPGLLRLGGSNQLEPLTISLPAACALINDGDRPHYIRGRVESGSFQPVGNQASHALFGLSQANGLVRVDPGQSVSAGEIVTVLWIGD
jgi:molybdopterin molybdotransferase